MNHLSFKKEEIDILCELVFIGNWVVNSCRIENEIEKYDKLADKVKRLHRHILPVDEHDSFDIDATRFYLDRLRDYIYEYEDECFFYVLAKKMAEANYPLDPQSKTFYGTKMHFNALYIYEKELLEKGMSIVSVDIPDMDDKLEIFRQAIKNKIPLFEVEL